MKIQVIYADGKVETLDMPAGSTWRVEDSNNGELYHIRSDYGFDYWFNADGTYDGWGGLVNHFQPDQSAAQTINAQRDAHHCIVAESHEA